MSFITLIFVVVCEVWWEAWGSSTSYTVNLAAVAVVSVGCTGKNGFFFLKLEKKKTFSIFQSSKVVSMVTLVCYLLDTPKL